MLRNMVSKSGKHVVENNNLAYIMCLEQEKCGIEVDSKPIVDRKVVEMLKLLNFILLVIFLSQ